MKHNIPPDLIEREVYYGQKSSERLDIYAQSPTVHEKDRLNEVLIFVPGGLWQGHNKKNYSHIAGPAFQAGMVTVVVQLPYYSGFLTRKFQNETELSTKSFTAQLRSLKKAIFWVSQHIRNYRGDPSRLVIMGFGSGAQLTGSLFFLPQYEDEQLTQLKKSLRKIVFISPILDILRTDNEFQKRHIEPVFQGIDKKKISLLNNLIPKNIPLLLLGPEQDFPFLQDQAKEFSEINSQVQYKIIQGVSRKSIIFRLGRKDTATNTLLEFLKL